MRTMTRRTWCGLLLIGAMAWQPSHARSPEAQAEQAARQEVELLHRPLRSKPGSDLFAQFTLWDKNTFRVPSLGLLHPAVGPALRHHRPRLPPLDPDRPTAVGVRTSAKREIEIEWGPDHHLQTGDRPGGLDPQTGDRVDRRGGRPIHNGRSSRWRGGPDPCQTGDPVDQRGSRPMPNGRSSRSERG
jgi:hypothetical protein